MSKLKPILLTIGIVFASFFILSALAVHSLLRASPAENSHSGSIELDRS